MVELGNSHEHAPFKMAYIGIKFHPDGSNSEKIRSIKQAVQDAGITPYAFVEETNTHASPQEMMAKDMQKMDECDVLVLDASEPSIGLGIEAQYAFGKKPIITIAEEGSTVSDSIKGISDRFLEYKNENDLKEKLKEALQ